MRCIIVDDEPLAIKVIEKHLSLIDGYDVIETFDSALPVFSYLQNNEVDLVFLDIEMPNLSGLNFLKSLTHHPQVILTTAHREYALESYDYVITDYLLKPISFERLLRAITKLDKNILEKESLPNAALTYHEDPPDQFAYFRIDRQNVQIHFKDIAYIESVKNHVKLVLDNGQQITQMSLQEVESKLSAKSFIRVHKSYVVAISKIQSFTNASIQIKALTIPIGRSYKQNVVRLLKARIF